MTPERSSAVSRSRRSARSAACSGPASAGGEVEIAGGDGVADLLDQGVGQSQRRDGGLGRGHRSVFPDARAVEMREWLPGPAATGPVPSDRNRFG